MKLRGKTNREWLTSRATLRVLMRWQIASRAQYYIVQSSGREQRMLCLLPEIVSQQSAGDILITIWDLETIDIKFRQPSLSTGVFWSDLAFNNINTNVRLIFCFYSISRCWTYLEVKRVYTHKPRYIPKGILEEDWFIFFVFVLFFLRLINIL